MPEIYIVQSKIKKYLKKKGCNTGSDALKMLSKSVEDQLTRAAIRAKSNRRKTVKASDV